jgi:hypothetical protein
MVTQVVDADLGSSEPGDVAPRVDAARAFADCDHGCRGDTDQRGRPAR